MTDITHDIRDAQSTINDESLRALAGNGALDARAFERAREILGITPSQSTWHAFLLRLGIIGGAALASAALVCFIAYNWSALGRWFRFGLVEGLIVLAVLVALVFTTRRTIHHAAALIAFFGLGGLLALTGQTYQTGADTWQLFAGWAALGLLWVLAARWWGLWLVWFLVAELGLYIWAFGDARLGRWLSRHDEPAIVLCLINLAAFAAFFWARRFTHLNVPWMWRTAAVFAVFWATVAASSAVWGNDFDLIATVHTVIGVGVLALMWWWTNRIGTSQFEPWLLYLVAFGAVAVSASWLAKLVNSISWELNMLVAVYMIGAAVFMHNLIRTKTKQHESMANGSASNTEGQE
jgi:uncharacterized membrane protein